MKFNKICKSRWIVLGLLIFFVVNCAEEVPVACDPDADQCTTESEGGFQTGSAAGIAAGAAAVGRPAAAQAQLAAVPNGVPGYVLPAVPDRHARGGSHARLQRRHRQLLFEPA